MHKIYLVFSLLFIFSPFLNAKPVDEQTAQQVAINFYLTRPAGQSLNAIFATLAHREEVIMLNNQVTDTPTTLYYVFDMDSQGFVIVSGDDNLIPIIGYSTEGIFPNEQMPIHVAKWFQQYKNEVRYILENDIRADDEIKQKWNNLVSGNATTAENTMLGVDPLLTTKWNQSPYYNDECPYNYLTFEHTVSGCVATATAQVMKYWNFPPTGYGYHSYDAPFYGNQSANFGATTYNWASMPNVVNSANNAVATLMYHCGVSVDMNYGIISNGGSSAQTLDVEYALKEYFGYAQTVDGVYRTNYTNSSWQQVLKDELNSNRPIQYAGTGSGGGHSFVCDGYDDNDFFHFNWGWGGTADGYFWIDELNPGSLGTGGGTGGFNSNHRAIIGIQPPSNPQTTSINLYSSISVLPNPIQYGQGFTVNADITNNGSSTFYGDITAALFDDSGNFIDYIETLTESNGLPPTYHYTNGLDFTTSGMDAAPGDYFIGIYVKPSNDWFAVGGGGYTNYIPVSIVYSNDIEMYANIVPSANPLIQNQPASFTLDLANFGFNDFNGIFSVDIHDLEGNWIQTIEELTGMALCANCHYQNGLTFSTSNLNLAPGTYLLAAWEKSNSADWDLVGSTSYINPIEITVAAPQLSPDIYENNNSQNSSYNVPISFSGNSANLKTTGSNSHIGTDYDYYKVVLPSGFTYTVTPRVHDSYNSGNGQTYTNDVLFSYNTNGTWSDAYDDVLSGNFTVSGNTTMYFQVAPYFQGQTGTYLLQIQITRTPATAVGDISENSGILVFPNPTSDLLTILSGNAPIEGSSIFDLSGKLAKKTGKSTEIDVSNLPAGSYIILIETDNSFVRRKFIKTSN
jgi:Peptidase C10 family/Spi protease inhibitor/Secretion system C-terminal sorting domain